MTLRTAKTLIAVMFSMAAQLVALQCGSASAATGSESRELFLRAQTAIANAQPRQARRLIGKLQHYPLTGYLELDLARKELGVSTHETIAAVMRKNGDLPSAFMLRRAWLKKLAHDGRWQLLLSHSVADDHTPSACLVAQAKWRLAMLEQAWHDARRLWLSGRSLPDACDPVLAAWREAGQLSEQLAWARAKLAMAQGQIGLASYLRRYAGAKYAALIEQWINLRKRPSRLVKFVKSAAAAHTDEDVAHVVIAVFTRAAKRDARTAQAIFAKLDDGRLPAPVMLALRDRISKALAQNGDAKAAQWLKYATSPAALRAQAVNALRARRHDTLLRAIEAMDDEQTRRERWRYWRAHAMGALGRNGEAGQAMRSLAAERSYYGFLAADRSERPYVLGHSALTSPPARLEILDNDVRMIRTREWLALKRSIEARREWHALLNSLDTQGRRDAAILARSWPWYEGAIRAAARAAAWNDLNVRFPIAFRADVIDAAARADLPPSRVYAVIRQESAFMQDIRSSAGALGLMQLMPATARQIARIAGQPKPNRASILNPPVNLLLGSLYLARLQSRYGGHAVLATAAYNAGPGRVRRWRRIPDTVDSQRWIEAIPFTETRRYVRSVLTYQIIYAERLGENELRLRDLMPPVKPARG